MSEAADAPELDADEIDLTDVPMDGEAEGDAEGEGEEGDKPPVAKKAPLPPEELEKRHANTRIALTTERAKRREMERELRDLRETVGGGRQPREEKAPVEEEDINPDIDPVGSLRQMKAKISAYEQAQRIDERSQADQSRRDAQLARVESELREHEIDFAEDNPDYGDAAKHYAETRAKELLSFGLTPQQVQPMLREEFATLAATAIKAGKNPAAVVYEMAKGRGYGKAAETGKKPAAGGQTKIDALNRGARAASPLRSGGRGSNGLDPTTVGNINIRSKQGRDAFAKAFDALEAQAKAQESGRR